MPMVYSVYAEDVSKNARVSTKPGVRDVAWSSIRLAPYFNLQAGDIPAFLSGIVGRVQRRSIASTSGTTITPTPKDPGMQTAKSTARRGSLSTSGTAQLGLVIGCSGRQPNSWVADNDDYRERLEGGSALSLDLVIDYSQMTVESISAAVTIEIQE